MTYTVDLTKELKLSDEGDLKIVDDGRNIGFLAYSTIYHQFEIVLNTLGINVNKKFLLQSDIRRIVGQTKKKNYEQ